ncbi:MAG: NDP-sugar synthase, partial [Polyangiaceae bacterium]|nr:NDP-sugar synthase [Polyangiaceae bacterium]
MILAAGLGTRLMPLTAHLPKPLVPVGDAPVLDHVLRGLEGVARGKVVVNAYHLSGALRAACDPARIVVVTEEALLGTAGGVRNAEPSLGDGDVLVWNGDILAPTLRSRDLVAAHRAESALATLAVRPRSAGEGNVGVDAAGRVVRLRGQRFGTEVRGGEFLGIHVLGPALRALLPAQGCLVGDVYLPQLGEGAHLRAFFTDAPFSDIGSLETYRVANRAWLD